MVKEYESVSIGLTKTEKYIIIVGEFGQKVYDREWYNKIVVKNNVLELVGKDNKVGRRFKFKELVLV